VAKIVFGMDIANLSAEKFDSDPLIVQRVTSAQRSALEKADNELEEVKKKVQLPPIVILIGMAAAAGVPLCAKIIQGMLKRRTWEEFMAQTPWMFYIMIGCAAVVVLVILLAVIRSKTGMRRNDVRKAVAYIDKVHEDSRNMLGVPVNTEYTDILSCVYRMNNGQRVIVKNGEVAYINNKCCVFREDNALCIADTAMKLEIPLQSIKAIRKIDQRVTVSKWNKETAYNKGEYREYRIKMTKRDQPIFKYYYALCFTHGSEEYELYFPPYELPFIEQLTNVRAPM